MEVANAQSCSVQRRPCLQAATWASRGSLSCWEKHPPVTLEEHCGAVGDSPQGGGAEEMM